MDTQNQEPRRASRRDVLVGAGGALAGMTLLSPAAALAAGRKQQALPRSRASRSSSGSTANIGDPFYKDGIAGMKEFTRIFGVPATIVGPVTNDIAGMTKTFAAVGRRPVDDRDLQLLLRWLRRRQGPVPAGRRRRGSRSSTAPGTGVVHGPRFVGVKDEDSGNAAVNYIGKYLGWQGHSRVHRQHRREPRP